MNYNKHLIQLPTFIQFNVIILFDYILQYPPLTLRLNYILNFTIYKYIQYISLQLTFYKLLS
jgi:hypothetical protein